MTRLLEHFAGPKHVPFVGGPVKIMSALASQGKCLTVVKPPPTPGQPGGLNQVRLQDCQTPPASLWSVDKGGVLSTADGLCLSAIGVAHGAKLITAMSTGGRGCMNASIDGDGFVTATAAAQKVCLAVKDSDPSDAYWATCDAKGGCASIKDEPVDYTCRKGFALSS